MRSGYEHEPDRGPYGCPSRGPQSDAAVFGDAVVMILASLLTILYVILRHPITCLALAILIGMVGEIAGWW